MPRNRLMRALASSSARVVRVRRPAPTIRRKRFRNSWRSRSMNVTSINTSPAVASGSMRTGNRPARGVGDGFTTTGNGARPAGGGWASLLISPTTSSNTARARSSTVPLPRRRSAATFVLIVSEYRGTSASTVVTCLPRLHATAPRAEKRNNTTRSAAGALPSPRRRRSPAIGLRTNASTVASAMGNRISRVK